MSNEPANDAEKSMTLSVTNVPTRVVGVVVDCRQTRSDREISISTNKLFILLD